MRVIITALALFAVAFAGCTDSGDGSASIYVKDAPTDEFSEIHVNFTQVQVHYAGNGSDDNETEEEDEGSWITLFENADGTDIDLLAASGNASAFLGEERLEPGKYTQIRIIVQSAYGIDHDGNTVDIPVSSGTLKIIKPFNVVAGEESKITVDIDLDRSLVKTGNQGWRMTPVVGSTVVEQVDDASSGRDAHSEGEIVTG